MDNISESPVTHRMNGGNGVCDRENCTGNPTNTYKGSSLCDHHFSQFMAMQQP